jgi:hypothetical protein
MFVIHLIALSLTLANGKKFTFEHVFGPSVGQDKVVSRRQTSPQSLSLLQHLTTYQFFKESGIIPLLDRYTSHLTPYNSHLTPHTSHPTPHTSHPTPHTPHLPPPTSHLPPPILPFSQRHGRIQRHNFRVPRPYSPPLPSRRVTFLQIRADWQRQNTHNQVSIHHPLSLATRFRLH